MKHVEETTISIKCIFAKFVIQFEHVSVYSHLKWVSTFGLNSAKKQQQTSNRYTVLKPPFFIYRVKVDESIWK